MFTKRKILLFAIPLILYAIYVLATLVLTPMLDGRMNGLQSEMPQRTANAAAIEFYNNLDFVADLHSDALLWKRDLSKQNDMGQVDIPRMKAANVDFQVFTVVSKSPAGLNFDSNSADAPDKITQLYIAQGRPMNTWFSLKNRAINQAKELQAVENDKSNNFKIIRSANDLKDIIAANKDGNTITAGLFGIEGLHVLEGKLENMELLYEHGVRMAGFVHFFDNKLGGSGQGVDKMGITSFGLAVLKKCEELGIIIDLAHASDSLFFDILKHATKPALVSHTGIVGDENCLPSRNLTDEKIIAVATQGGIIGIAYLEELICGSDYKTIARQIKYVRDLVGVECVALGSDSDGAARTLISLAQQPLLVEELLNLGFSEAEVRLVMGGNVKRFLLAHLPN